MLIITKGKIQGIKYESYIPTDELKEPLVILIGMNITPESNYLRDLPLLLAKNSNFPVFVVYQPGVSRLLGFGYYSEKTEIEQLEAAMELVGNKPFTPITHSFSTILGIRLLDKEFRERFSKNIMPGVLTSTYESVKDCLTDENNIPRTIFRINALSLFQIGQYFPIILPIYPLRHEGTHAAADDEEKESKELTASQWINTKTAKYCLETNGLELATNLPNQDQIPLGIITSKDRIIDPEKQEQILKQLKATIVRIPTGHRWTKNTSQRNSIEQAIISHHRRNLENFLNS